MPKEERPAMKRSTVLDKIVVAIGALNTPGGCSRQAIAKGVGGDVTAAAALKAALARGVASGVLVQEGQRFWVAGHPPPPPPAESTVGVEDTLVGGGALADSGSQCTMSYVGRLADGGAQVIRGWDAGVKGMRVGGSRTLRVPAKLGYGKRGSPPEIPPDADLVFDVRLLAIA